MHDDDLLRRLAEAAREEEGEERARLDDRWDALSAGTLPPGEEEALRKEAESSMEAQQAYAAFSPLSSDFRSRMVAEARTGLAPAPGHPAPEDLAAPRSPVALRRVRRDRLTSAHRRFLPWAAAALAAAGLMLVLWPSDGRPALPQYTLRLYGAVPEMRSGEPPAAPESIPVFVPGNRFELILTPDQAVEERPVVRLYAQRAGRLAPWPAPVEISTQGAVRIAGEVGKEIQLPAGEVTLLVAVGRPGSLPPAQALAAQLGASDRARAEHWNAWRVNLILEPER